MKNKRFNLLFKILFAFSIIVFLPQQTEAQFLKKLVKKAKEKVDREAERRAQKRVDKKIDKTFDDAEDTIDGKKKKKNGEKSNQKKNKQASQNSNDANQKDTTKKVSTVVWNKFDFIPGDTVIFEDGPSADEENGEFPSRWDLYKGNVEIGEVDGKNVIMFLSSSSAIIPYLKNSNEDYLPNVFTLELDVWFPKGHTTANRLWIYLGDQKNNNRSNAAHKSLIVMPHSLEFGDSEKSYPGTENIGWTVEREGSWKHISIAYTKGKFKAYFNDTRLINVPHLEVNPTGITIASSSDKLYIKNIRIAKGGVKYYDRVLTDGKIIVNGIKFDVNKATLKPESMGPINKIYNLMVKNPNLNFSVEGHTDSDGSDEINMKLSKARGKTVMDKLVAMGIDASRLKYNGFGESKPIDTNGTPEGKANNRRVEFVKF
jgi:outer membrane protein OmpA-like peptidoglycan-associated protein